MDSELLRFRIKSSGVTMSEIAHKMGYSRQHLHSKMTGKADFKATEIRRLASLINLSKNDIINIFFAVNVDSREQKKRTKNAKKT